MSTAEEMKTFHLVYSGTDVVSVSEEPRGMQVDFIRIEAAYVISGYSPAEMYSGGQNLPLASTGDLRPREVIGTCHAPPTIL